MCICNKIVEFYFKIRVFAVRFLGCLDGFSDERGHTSVFGYSRLKGENPKDKEITWQNSCNKHKGPWTRSTQVWTEALMRQRHREISTHLILSKKMGEQRARDGGMGRWGGRWPETRQCPCILPRRQTDMVGDWRSLWVLHVNECRELRLWRCLQVLWDTLRISDLGVGLMMSGEWSTNLACCMRVLHDGELTPAEATGRSGI